MKPVALGVSLLLLAWAVAQVVAVAQGATLRGEVGYDATFYASLGQRFIETGELYFPAQFAGPYAGEGMVNLYPPLAMYLFVPFAFLPTVLWWAIPLGVLGWHLWSCRPAWWTWPLLAGIAALLPTATALVYGNTILWSMAFVAVGLRYPAAAVLLALKPTDAIMWPLFVRRRSFWIGLAIVGLASLPFGVVWFDWVTALGNVEAGSPLRNVAGLPLLLLPVVAWSGRQRRSRLVTTNPTTRITTRTSQVKAIISKPFIDAAYPR